MTTVREAATQALEAMLNFPDDISDEMFESITALKAALAQKHDPVAHSGWVLREVLFDNGEPIGHREPQHSPAALAQQAEPVEPVAWRYQDARGNYRYRGYVQGFDKEYSLLKPVPLYAAPPQRPADPVQEPVWVCPDSAEHRYQKPGHCEDCGKTLVQERNFCPRCGKRTNGIHTCTPPAPLTDEVIAELWHQNCGFHHHFARAIERWLKGNP